jgi:RHH-type transcriptional regulator, rel operon repressor / antitoxin RelB
MPETTTITIEVPADTERRVTDLAEATGRTRSQLALDALQQYLDVDAWQVAQIHSRIKEADAGAFATDEEVQAIFTRWTSGQSG